ncbi:MAG: hypothetical protein E7523_03200 [Ruminococcaceae bacterium]|nr:hypothetical protein [Oscillospiraceae bacterium]
MPKFLLGIDAGGTKTDFALADHNLNIMKNLTLGGANPVDVGMEQMQNVLQEGIEYCCDGISPDEISCFAGIAGGITGDNKEIIHSFLSQFGFGSFCNGSDIDNCIAMTLGKNDGIVVIMGTGIVVFCQINSTLHRIGGWGYLLDKAGSGYHIGADALYCALGCYDGRGGSMLMKSLIEEKLNKTIPEAIPEIYAGGKSEVASFTPIVFEAYKQKDDYAKTILNRNVQEVASLIKTAQKIAQTEDLPVFICGGLTNEKDILVPFFKQHLPCCELLFSNNRPVNGALKKAHSIFANGE